MRNIREGFSARGYDLPPGALAGAEIEAYRNAGINKENLNADIAIKQAELAQANTQFITDKGVQLEQILRGFHESQAGRSFEAAKMVFQSGIELMNAHIAKINLDLERYKAEAVVYESRVKAALTAVEIFKAQVESAKVASDVQKNMVDIYEKQIAAIDTYVKMYATQMEAVKIAAQIEQTKMEIYNLETKAYIARMDAEKIKFDVYATQVDAEKAKATMYAEQVRAYIAEVEGAKAQLEAENIKLEAVLKENAMLIDKYKGELAGYTAEIDAVGKELSATVDSFRAEVQAYSAETNADAMYYQTKIKEIDSKIMEARFHLEKAVAEVKATTDGYIAIKSLEEKGTEGIMNVGAQLAASAMNAVNASASTSYNQGEDYSWRQSLNNSLSESHSYKEE
jgi:chromosome segregation ATPase